FALAFAGRAQQPQLPGGEGGLELGAVVAPVGDKDLPGPVRGEVWAGGQDRLQGLALVGFRHTGDRRSLSPSGRITLDIRVIIASLFDPICGDDHPYIAEYLLVPLRIRARVPAHRTASYGRQVASCLHWICSLAGGRR